MTSALADPVMDPSQVRRLAKDYATGQLSLEAYRHRRRALLDSIVEGTVTIDREGAGDHPEAHKRGTNPPRPAPTRPAAMSRSVWAGTAALVLLAWALWSSLRPTPAPVESALPRLPVPERQVSVARGVVEAFLAARDWDERRIQQFEHQWDALEPEDRARARAAPWFARLIATLNDELEARATFNTVRTEPAASARVERLLALGSRLGIASELSLNAALTTESAPTKSSSPLRTLDADHEPSAEPSPVPRDPAETAWRNETSSQWLVRQRDDAFTLQLFALEHLDQVERMMARHPSLMVHVLDLRDDSPRFRVLHGSFDSRQAAVAAHEGLPQSLRSRQSRADVKRFADLKSAWAAARERTKPPVPDTTAG